MKKSLILLAAVLPFTACNKKKVEVAAPVNPQSAKTFDAAGAYLETGGDFYFYLRTEQVLEGIPAAMDEWKTALVGAMGDKLPLPPEEVDAYYNAIRKTVVDTGVTQLRAFGMSGIEIEQGVTRARSIFLTGELTNPGLLWRLGGRRAPHAIAPLDFLPATTVYAGYSDFDPAVLWAFVQQVMKDIPNPALQQQADQMTAMSTQMLGLPLAELLASLDSEMGFVITADESRTMTVPIDGKPLVLPSAAAALLVRVKDDKLYNLIVRKLDESIGVQMPLQKSDADGLRLAVVPVPPNEQIPLSPAVGYFGNFVVISSSDELVRQLARKGPNPPALMKDTPEFQKFAKREKMEANALAYLSERGAAILRDVQMSSMNADIPPALQPNMKKLYDLFSQKFFFSLGRTEKDGFSSVIYSSQGATQMVAVAAIIPVAIGGALAVPAITAAQQKDEATKMLGEIKQIAVALQQYELDNAPPEGTVIPAAALADYIGESTDLGLRLKSSPPFVDGLGNPYPDLVAGSKPHVSPLTAARFPKLTAKGFWGEFYSGGE